MKIDIRLIHTLQTDRKSVQLKRGNYEKTLFLRGFKPSKMRNPQYSTVFNILKEFKARGLIETSEEVVDRFDRPRIQVVGGHC